MNRSSHPIAALIALLIFSVTPILAQEPLGAASTDSVLIRASESRMKGAADAPVTIVEISDFQCPFCREFTLTTGPALDSAYVSTGKVRVIYINYPLPMHPRSWVAAEAALCAGAQGDFWGMHDRLFDGQPEWSTSGRPADFFDRYATELGLDIAAFRSCTNEDKVAALIIDDLLQAARSGITGTPTFVFNGQRVLSGALTFEQMTTEIEALLKN